MVGLLAGLAQWQPAGALAACNGGSFKRDAAWAKRERTGWTCVSGPVCASRPLAASLNMILDEDGSVLRRVRTVSD